MCIPGVDPATLSAVIAAITTAAGTATQYSAQQSANKAADQAAAKQLMDQSRLRQEANESFDKTRQHYDPGAQSADLTDLTQTRKDAYDRSIYPDAGGSYELPGSGTQSSVIRDVLASRVAQATDGLQRRSTAKAKLDGLADLFVKNSLFTARQAGEANRISDASRGFGGLLAGELEAARRKAQSPLGDALVGAGSIASSYFANLPDGTPGAAGAPKNILSKAAGRGVKTAPVPGLGNVGSFQNGLY